MLNITKHQGNANQSYNTTLYLFEWLLTEKQKITSVGENVEKREPSHTAGGNVNQHSHCGKQYGGPSKN